MMTQIHRLKTIARYFEAVERGEKTFEIRRNDRAFQTGDILVLEKFREDMLGYVKNGSEPFYPISLWFRITYILQGGQFGIEPGYCVMGLKPIEMEAE